MLLSVTQSLIEVMISHFSVDYYKEDAVHSTNELGKRQKHKAKYHELLLLLD